MSQERRPDSLDQEIVRLLQHDPQTTNKSIARKVDVAETTVALRIRAMSENAVMRVVVQRDFETVGFDHMAVLLLRAQGRPVHQIAHELSAMPQTNCVCSTLGSADIFAIVGVHNHDELRRIADHELTKISGLVCVDEMMCLDVLSADATFGNLAARHDLPIGRSRLEAIEESILKPLQGDARVSNREIGRRLNISEGAVRMRLKRLSEAAKIRWSVVLSPAAFGFGATACIRVAVAPAQVAPLVAGFDGRISFAARTTGRYNLVLLVHAATDQDIVDLCDMHIRACSGVREIDILKIVTSLKHNYHIALVRPAPAARAGA